MSEAASGRSRLRPVRIRGAVDSRVSAPPDGASRRATGGRPLRPRGATHRHGAGRAMPPTSSVIMPPGRQSRSSSAASSDHPCDGSAWAIVIFDALSFSLGRNEYRRSRPAVGIYSGRLRLRNAAVSVVRIQRRAHGRHQLVRRPRTGVRELHLGMGRPARTVGRRCGRPLGSRTIAVSLGFPPHAPRLGLGVRPLVVSPAAGGAGCCGVAHLHAASASFGHTAKPTN